MRFIGVGLLVFAVTDIGCDSILTLAHRAFCACAILRREAADMTRAGWFAARVVAEPFHDSMAEMA